MTVKSIGAMGWKNYDPSARIIRNPNLSIVTTDAGAAIFQKTSGCEE
jgi:hypothetical protein